MIRFYNVPSHCESYHGQRVVVVVVIIIPLNCTSIKQDFRDFRLRIAAAALITLNALQDLNEFYYPLQCICFNNKSDGRPE